MGLRVLRSRASASSLDVVLEGLAGRTYDLGVRGRAVGATEGVTIVPGSDGAQTARVTFSGSPGTYVRREIHVPFAPRAAPAPRSAPKRP